MLLKKKLVLYADNEVLNANSATELQIMLSIMNDRWN